MLQRCSTRRGAELLPAPCLKDGQKPRTRKVRARIAYIALACIFATLAAIAGPHPPGATNELSNRLFLSVEIDQNLKLSALKPGEIIEGKLAQPVYAEDRQVFPAGSHIRLTVNKLERRRKEKSNDWPWVIKVFMPRRENYPVFRSASVRLSDGAEIPLNVSLISVITPVRVSAQAQRKSKKSLSSRVKVRVLANTATQRPAKRQKAPQTLFFEADGLTPAELAEATSGEPALPSLAPEPVTLKAGTQARVILLQKLSASKSRVGEPFRALLLRPVRVNSRIVLPQGTLFEGKVDKRTPPRWLSRAGSLHISFTELTLPSSGGHQMTGSLTEADLDKKARTRMGSEGELRGGRPGTAWMLINLGVAGGISKVSDDTFQVIIEAIVSTATDASTAGTARIVAGCASGIFFITRHGRDVILPKYTEMDIVFNEPVTLSGWRPAVEGQAAAMRAPLTSLRGE